MASRKTVITSASSTVPRPGFDLSIRLSQVWAAVGVVIPVLVLAGTPLVAIDLAYQLRAGDIMLNTHGILRTDVFSAVAPGGPWLNQQWLAQIIMSIAFRLGGWFGLVALRALLTGLVLTFVFLACRATGAASRRAAWLTLASGALLASGFMLRSQLLGMLCFALTAWLVARRRTHPRGVWVVIPITIVWANLHGSFFLAPLLLGLGWVQDRWGQGRAPRTLLMAGIGSVLATTLNPFGYRVWIYAVDLARNPVIRRTIVEWQPPTIETYTGATFFLSIVAVAGLLIARVRRPVPWGSLVPLIAFLTIALTAVRGAYWWAMVVPIVLAGVLADRPDRPAPAERRDPAGPLNVAIIGVLALAVLATMIRWAPYTGSAIPGPDRLSYAPVGITDQLHRILRPGQVVFDAQEWGSWLELEFPRNPVVVDSLIEVIPEGVWWKYYSVSLGAEGWQATLDSWDVDVAVLARDQQADLIPRIKRDPGWRLVYEDAEGLIFIRA